MRKRNFIQTLLLGKQRRKPKQTHPPVLLHQWQNIKDIWENKQYNDFGLERLIRLTLSIAIFLFPGIYVKAFFERFGMVAKSLGVELYVLAKLLLPILFLKTNWSAHLITAIFSGYLALETVVYLATLIYLSNELVQPISYRRSLTTVMLNYIEVTLNYAVIYSYCNDTIPNFFNEMPDSDIEIVYFSFATSATVGYGDFVTSHPFGQHLVISQIILFLVFVGLFLNFFAPKIHEPTFYNKQQNHEEANESENLE